MHLSKVFMYLLASEQELKIGSLCCRPPHLLNGWESNPCLVHLTIYQRCWGWAIIGDPSLTPDMPSSPIRGSHSLHLSWQPERVVPWLLFGDVMAFLHLLSYGNLTSSFSCHQTMDSTSLLLGEESINQSAWEREKPREVHPSLDVIIILFHPCDVPSVKRWMKPKTCVLTWVDSGF